MTRMETLQKKIAKAKRILSRCRAANTRVAWWVRFWGEKARMKKRAT